MKTGISWLRRTGSDHQPAQSGISDWDGRNPNAGRRGQTNVTWSKLDGPDDVQFSDPNALNTSVQFSKPGSYTLKLQVACASGTLVTC